MRTPSLARAARLLMAVAFAWTVANAVYVYFVLGGDRLFRLEAAFYILIAFSALAVGVGGRSPSRNADLPARAVLAFAIAVVMVWMVILLPQIQFPLLSDDYVFRARAADMTGTVGIGEFFRPAFGWAFAFLDRVGSLNSTVPFHVTSFGLHGTSAALTATIAWRLTQRRDAAMVAGALFLLNPAQLEATLWVSGLQEQLWTTALLAALVVYTRDARLTAPAAIGTGVLVAAALLSKETAVAAALILPVVDGILYRWRRGRWLWRSYGALIILVAAYLGLRSQYIALESTFLVVPSQFFVKQLVSMPFKTLAQPWNVDAMRVPLWIALATALVPATLLGLVVWRGRGDWRLLLGPALVIGSVLPVYSYFFVDANLMSSRYIYFAAAGWAILMADLLARATASRAVMMAAGGVVIAVSAVTLTLNLRPWRAVAVMVTDMESRLAAGEAPETVVTSWQQRLGSDLTLQDGIPGSYRGVYVFENGWREFVEDAKF